MDEIIVEDVVVLVDVDDYEMLKKYKWHLLDGYATTKINGKSVKMHRLIMGNPQGKLVDHRKRNILDNRKKNLRVCTKAENNRNRKGNDSSTSKYKGVSFKERDNAWVAKIGVGGTTKNLGQYKTEIDAALAYDRSAEIEFGEFAYLNFPDRKDVPVKNKSTDSSFSGYRGVAFYKKNNSWISRIEKNKKRIFIGYFKTKELAAIAYNKKAIELLGDKAILNVILEV